MARVVLDQVVKRYGKVLAVDHVSLEVADGEFLALLGPSGCGKTSTMRMISGLEEITEGFIFIGDTLVNGLAPAQRNVAMAFENYGLYPHLTLFNNIAYPLRLRHVSPSDIQRDVMNIAQLLNIEDQLDRKPGEVSGGVQQRVSLARALVRRPSVFLLDEPLSHLDAELRGRMRGELKRIHKLNQATTIYVTHDQLEAMTMADRIAVMHHGRFQQVGTPADVFYRPANRFVASFIGEPAMNILRGWVERSSDGALVNVGGHPFIAVGGELAAAILDASSRDNGTIEVGVRPPDFELQADSSQGLPARVRMREFLGEDVLLTLNANGDRLRIVVPRDAIAAEGSIVTLRPRQDRVHFFATTSGEAIGHTGQPERQLAGI